MSRTMSCAFWWTCSVMPDRFAFLVDELRAMGRGAELGDEGGARSRG
jgi:hypothetical protein